MELPKKGIRASRRKVLLTVGGKFSARRHYATPESGMQQLTPEGAIGQPKAIGCPQGLLVGIERIRIASPRNLHRSIRIVTIDR